MAVRTAKQKAALRKAQLASAKKRKRHALVRNVGRGVAGKKNGSRKKRYKVARYAGGLAAAGAVAYGHHKVKQHLKSNDYRGHVVVAKHHSGMTRKKVVYGKDHHRGTTKVGASVRIGNKRYGAGISHRRR